MPKSAERKRSGLCGFFHPRPSLRRARRSTPHARARQVSGDEQSSHHWKSDESRVLRASRRWGKNYRASWVASFLAGRGRIASLQDWSDYVPASTKRQQKRDEHSSPACEPREINYQNVQHLALLSNQTIPTTDYTSRYNCISPYERKLCYHRFKSSSSKI